MFARQLVFSFIFLFIGLPVFVFGMIHNFIQYKVVDLLVVKNVKDVEYHAPISVLISLIMYPAFYTGFLLTFSYICEPEYWMKWIYFFSMPASGLMAYYYFQYYKHVRVKSKFIFLMRRNKTDVESLRKERESLRKLVFGD